MSCIVHQLKKKLEKPLIVILGSTAVGKSKLAIELATKLNGEIISADSMQVYEGLDIITNKVTKEEQSQVKHHLINVIKPPAEFTVKDFQKKSLEIINGLHEKKIIPIIVGGTNYYIESILWNFLIKENDTTVATEGLLKRKLIPDETDELHKINLYKELQDVDPERASQLHPNNTRKIARSLQIYKDSGMKHSEFIKIQQENSGASKLGGSLRFRNVLIFWLKSDQQVLDERICQRVDEMIKKGLLSEVLSFYKQYKSEKYKSTHSNIVNSSKLSTSLSLYEEGLFQAIGFKEFHSYFTLSDDIDNVKKEKVLKECIENFKNATIKYSKKQIKWVTQRFVNRQNSLDIYELDATDLLRWNETVLEKAVGISNEFLDGLPISTAPIFKESSESITIDKHKKHVCDICDDKIIIGDNTWDIHLNSRTHKRRLQRLRKEKDKS